MALAAAAYFAGQLLLVVLADQPARPRAAARDRPLRGLPYQAFVILALLSAAPLVAVVMGADSAWLVLLFAAAADRGLPERGDVGAARAPGHHDELTGLPNRKLLMRRTRRR